MIIPVRFDLVCVTNKFAIFLLLFRPFFYPFIKQNSHQLSTYEPGSSGHHYRHIYHTKNYFKTHYNTPRRSDGKGFMHTADRRKLFLGRSGLLSLQYGCHSDRALLCGNISTRQQRKTYHAQTEGMSN